MWMRSHISNVQVRVQCRKSYCVVASTLRFSVDHARDSLHAARGFKAAGSLDAAIDAWRKAADCSYKIGNLKQGSNTLETAGREVSALAKTNPERVEACRLYAEAGGFLQEAGEIVRSVDLKLRAAKLVEGFDPDMALRMVDESCNLFDGDSDKDVYAVEPLRKILQMQLSLGKHASAMRTFDKLYAVWTRLDQKHNLYKVILSKVVLLLAAADPVSAQREYETHFDLDGFTSANECAASEDLLSAYSTYDRQECMHARIHSRAQPPSALLLCLAAEMNPDEMKKVLERSCFGYLENAVTRVAKQLPEAVMEGKAVGFNKADEAASKAVNHTTGKNTLTSFTELGGAGVAIGGGGSRGGGGGGGAASIDRETEKAEERARAKAAKDGDLRASLFARPAGAGSGSAAAAAPMGEEAHGAGDGGDDAFAFGGGEDVDAAFAELNGTGGAPSAAQGGQEEDLGLM